MTQPQQPISNLESIPDTREVHQWADYVELLCLANPDGLVSKADLLDRWAERTDVGESDVAAALEPDEEPEEAEDTAEMFGPVETGTVGGRAAQHDRRVRMADDIFRHLTYRRATFGNAYPFEFTTGGALQRRENLTVRRKLYSFLLLASSLRYVRASARASITKGFEQLSASAMKSWLPKHAEVHVFGTSAGVNARYKGTLKAKLERLAKDLAETLLLSEDDFRRGDTGDAGADVVAWFSVGDANSGLVVFLAQATCQADWKDKQHESGHDAWRKVMTFTTLHNNVMFIPFCFRQPDGAWSWPRNIQGSILIDRVRLFWILRKLAEPLPAAPLQLVDSALAFREPRY